jgi:hypothetical protein
MPKFLSQVDLSKIPIRGLVAESGPTAPASPVNGQFWYDSSVNKLKVYQAGAWVILDLDTNTTYASGTAAAVVTGTDTFNYIWTPAVLKSAITGVIPGGGTAALIATGTDTTERSWTASVLKAAASANSPVQSVAGRTGAVVLSKSDVGLANVDNTADTAKPVSTAQQTALNLKADLAGPTFTGNPKAVTPTAGDNSTNLATTAFVTAAVSSKANLASPTFTGTVIVPTPTVGTAAANKDYVDGLIQGLDAKGSVRAATTAGITLSGTQTVDGVALVAGDRVLVKDQPLPKDNGIYTVATGTWVRAVDANTWAELVGAFTFVEDGNTQSNTGWVSKATPAGTLETNNIAWYQFSSAGVISAGEGLTKSGNTISILDGGVSAIKLAPGAVALDTDRVGGILPIEKGGTGSDTAAWARSNLGALGKARTPMPAMAAGSWVTVPIYYANIQQDPTFVQLSFTDVNGETIIVDWKTVNTSGDISLQAKVDVAMAVNTVFVVAHGPGLQG